MVDIIEHETPRKLGERDFRLMNLPRNSWGSRLRRVHVSAQSDIRNYVERRKQVMSNGWGLLIAGEPGSGKTSIVSGILKVMNAYGYSAYYTTPLQLKEAQLNHVMYDDHTSLLRRCMEVDILALDEIGVETARDPIVGPGPITQLIRYRRDQRRPTLAVIPVDPEGDLDSVESFRYLLDLHGVWVVVRVLGQHEPEEMIRSLRPKWGSS